MKFTILLLVTSLLLGCSSTEQISSFRQAEKLKSQQEFRDYITLLVETDNDWLKGGLIEGTRD